MTYNSKTTAPAASATQQENEEFTSQAREAHLAMENIWTEKWTLAQAAQELGKTKEELAIQFAIFGIQAMEVLRSKGVFDQTLFLAMGKNKEGYGPNMVEALEEARSQKGKEAAMRRKNQGLPLTRGNHDDLEDSKHHEDVAKDARAAAVKTDRRKSGSKSGERVRQPGELAPVSGNLQTIFHGQYGGQWAGGRH